jgi:hypothetical protein
VKQDESAPTEPQATPPPPQVPTSQEPKLEEEGKSDQPARELQEIDYQKLAINIKHMFVDDLTKHLFQLLLGLNTTTLSPPSWSGLNTISLVLRTISTLFVTMREHMIPQQQWFISHLIKSCEKGVHCWDIDEWAQAATGIQSKTKESKSNADSNPVSNQPPGPRVPVPVLVPEVRELFLETLLQVRHQFNLFS